MNGARIRNTKRHLSQSQHQEPSRSSGSRWKTRLQLVKTGWYWVELRERPGDRELRGRTQDREDLRRALDLGDGVGEQSLGAAALGELVVDLDRRSRRSCRRRRCVRWRAATASKPCVAAVSSATQLTIAVIGTWPLSAPLVVELEQARVDRARDQVARQSPATLRGLADRQSRRRPRRAPSRGRCRARSRSRRRCPCRRRRARARARVGRAPRARLAVDAAWELRDAAGCSSPLTTANSPRPSEYSAESSRAAASRGRAGLADQVLRDRRLVVADACNPVQQVEQALDRRRVGDRCAAAANVSSNSMSSSA